MREQINGRLLQLTAALGNILFNFTTRADEFSRWTWRVPNPPAILLEKVTFANNLFSHSRKLA